MINPVMIILGVLLIASPKNAEGNKLHGFVKSAETSELVPMSRVYVYGSDKRAKSGTVLSSSGEFTIVGIPAGSYSLFVSHEGYRPVDVRKIEVKDGIVAEVTLFIKASKTCTDSTDVILPGEPGIDYKMQYAEPPNLKIFR
jgi:hypothetical protein